MTRSFPLKLALFSSTLLVSGIALAASVFSHSAEHLAKKSPSDVLTVLTAYGQICDSGCKYYGPDVKQFYQLSYKKTESSWYTWTWVSTSMKDVKYYSQVKVEKRADGVILMTTRQLDASDEAIANELREKTKREHNPAFDNAKTVFTLTPQGDGSSTKVVQAMTMTASGMLAMFGGKIEQGMKDGAAATFRNLDL